MSITAQQEKFSQEVAAGRSHADAYRAAYPKSLKWSPQIVANNAYKLTCSGEILARIDQIRAELAEKGIWAREQSVRALVSVVNAAEKASDLIAAVKVLNEMHGYNAPVKVEHGGSALEELFSSLGGKVWGPVTHPEEIHDDEG